MDNLVRETAVQERLLFGRMELVHPEELLMESDHRFRPKDSEMWSLPGGGIATTLDLRLSAKRKNWPMPERIERLITRLVHTRTNVTAVQGIKQQPTEARPIWEPDAIT